MSTHIYTYLYIEIIRYIDIEIYTPIDIYDNLYIPGSFGSYDYLYIGWSIYRPIQSIYTYSYIDIPI